MTALAKKDIYDPKALPRLIKLLDDDHLEVRKGTADAIRSLARLGVTDLRSRAPLEKLTQDEDQPVRESAVRALALIGGGAA